MRGFLFDENLPRRLTFTPSLPITFSASVGQRLSDNALWDHARDHALVIVSKDADFSGRIMLAAPPPWIVHLRFGNLRRSNTTPCWPRCGRTSKPFSPTIS